MRMALIKIKVPGRSSPCYYALCFLEPMREKQNSLALGRVTSLLNLNEF